MRERPNSHFHWTRAPTILMFVTLSAETVDATTKRRRRRRRRRRLMLLPLSSNTMILLFAVIILRLIWFLFFRFVLTHKINKFSRRHKKQKEIQHHLESYLCCRFVALIIHLFIYLFAQHHSFACSVSPHPKTWKRAHGTNNNWKCSWWWFENVVDNNNAMNSVVRVYVVSIICCSIRLAVDCAFIFW